MKTCPRCGETKPLDQFNRDRTQRDGHCRRCKLCHRKAAGEWQRGKGKAKHAAAVKRWQSGSGRRAMSGAKMAAYRREPEKYQARMAVYRAVKSGKLVRPDRCDDCNVPCRPQAHHHRGYSAAARLDVVWLCDACHRAKHPKHAHGSIEVEPE
jgi:hypothetical protein